MAGRPYENRQEFVTLCLVTIFSLQVAVWQGDQTEDNDEDDPEYKAPQVIAEEEEEEYRTDMAVKVSYKELSSLLEEFIETVSEIVLK
jgi:hypothetical protein